MNPGSRDPLFIPTLMANDSQQSAAVVLPRAVPIVMLQMVSCHTLATTGYTCSNCNIPDPLL